MKHRQAVRVTDDDGQDDETDGMAVAAWAVIATILVVAFVAWRLL